MIVCVCLCFCLCLSVWLCSSSWAGLSRVLSLPQPQCCTTELKYKYLTALHCVRTSATNPIC